MYQCIYDNRDLDIQIRIDNLQNAHEHKYPLSWYESRTNAEIKAMHTARLVAYAKELETQAVDSK